MFYEMPKTVRRYNKKKIIIRYSKKKHTYFSSPSILTSVGNSNSMISSSFKILAGAGTVLLLIFEVESSSSYKKSNKSMKNHPFKL